MSLLFVRLAHSLGTCHPAYQNSDTAARCPTVRKVAFKLGGGTGRERLRRFEDGTIDHMFESVVYFGPSINRRVAKLTAIHQKH